MEKETIENLFEEENKNIEEKVEVKEEVEKNNTELNAFVDLPPVAPVDYEQTEEIVTEEASEELVESVEPVVEEQQIDENNKQVVNKEVLEHPDAKITLNNEKEEEIDKKELEELKDIKLSDNSSLRFVLILGLILLIVIFLIPFVSEYI